MYLQNVKLTCEKKKKRKRKVSIVRELRDVNWILCMIVINDHAELFPPVLNKMLQLRSPSVSRFYSRYLLLCELFFVRIYTLSDAWIILQARFDQL